MPLLILLIALFATLTVRSDLIFGYSGSTDPQGWVTRGQTKIISSAESGEVNYWSIGITPEQDTIFCDIGRQDSNTGVFYEIWSIQISNASYGATIPQALQLNREYTQPAELAWSNETQSWPPFIAFGSRLEDGVGRSAEDGIGKFTILELSFGENGSINQLAFDFEKQYRRWNDYGSPRIDIGSVRYNSNIPLTVPEPTSAALLVISLLFLRPFMARRNQ